MSNRGRDPKKMPEHKRTLRRKRNHKLKCLRCEQPFLSRDMKTNRICLKCKSDEAWSFAD